MPSGRRCWKGADLKANIQEMIGKELTSLVRSHLSGDPMEWETEALLAEVSRIMPLPAGLDASAVVRDGANRTEEALFTAAEALYERREEEYGAELMRNIERSLMLQTIDRLWVDHLTMMSNLRQGIGLQAAGQRDPLVMYKREGHSAFEGLLERIQHDIIHLIFHVAPTGYAGSAPAGPGNAGQRPVISNGGTETVLSKALGQQRGSARQAPVDVPADAPRSVRRQAARAAGGSKKSRKRKDAS